MLDDDRKVGALLILNEVGGDGADLIAWFAVLQNEAETLVLRYRRFIEALAARLLDARSLTREEIAETIESVRAEIAHERLCDSVWRKAITESRTPRRRSRPDL